MLGSFAGRTRNEPPAALWRAVAAQHAEPRWRWSRAHGEGRTGTGGLEPKGADGDVSGAAAGRGSGCYCTVGWDPCPPHLLRSAPRRERRCPPLVLHLDRRVNGSTPYARS
ncbi:hypothetical protein GCM10023347_31650 [Streptomyces chumphonensis]